MAPNYNSLTFEFACALQHAWHARHPQWVAVLLRLHNLLLITVFFWRLACSINASKALFINKWQICVIGHSVQYSRMLNMQDSVTLTGEAFASVNALEADGVEFVGAVHMLTVWLIKNKRYLTTFFLLRTKRWVWSGPTLCLMPIWRGREGLSCPYVLKMCCKHCYFNV